MRTRVAHAPRFVNTNETRRTALSVNPQFTTYKPKNSVQTTGATAEIDRPDVAGQYSQQVLGGEMGIGVVPLKGDSIQGSFEGGKWKLATVGTAHEHARQLVGCSRHARAS